MRLLILTQKIHRTDPVLGFFQGWVEAFAPHFSSVLVLALEVGNHNLPAQIRVESLGKERGNTRLQKIRQFYRFIRKHRSEYDAVLVHMNQEYVLLGGVFWWIWGKKVYLWRNHYQGSVLTDIAAFLSTKVFCTSRYSYTAKYKKTRFMPVGIDTKLFKENHSAVRKKGSVLFLSRMAPAKRPDMLLRALCILAARKVVFFASFYGDPLPRDRQWYEILKGGRETSILGPHVSWHPAIQHSAVPEIYNAHEVFVNCSPSGMFDKTMFEAMACGAIPLSSSKDLAAMLGKRFFFAEGKEGALAEKLEYFLEVSEDEKKDMRERLRSFVEKEHSLPVLSEKLAAEIMT